MNKIGRLEFNLCVYIYLYDLFLKKKVFFGVKKKVVLVYFI